MHVAESFALYIQGNGPVYARADGYGFKAVAEQLFYAERLADSYIELDFYAELAQNFFVLVHYRFGQAEVGNAVTKYSAYFRFGFENSYVVAELSHFYGYGNARGACAHDGDFYSVGFCLFQLYVVDIVGRDEVFNRADFHGFALYAAHAVTLTLVAVVAYERADYRKRVVFEHDFTRFLNFARKKERNHFGYGGVYGAPGSA